MMETIERMPWLSSPVYTTPIKIAKYNCKLTATTGHTDAGATIIKRLAPHWTKEDHKALAEHHMKRAIRLQSIWGKVSERAATQAFGRPFEITDYKITAVCRDEFSEAKKRVLRHCAYKRTKHLDLVRVHLQLAREK